MKKTLYTMLMEANRTADNVEAVGKARFADGQTAKERTLWRVKTTGEEFVMLNGNAHRFTRWDEQDGKIYGFI